MALVEILEVRRAAANRKKVFGLGVKKQVGGFHLEKPKVGDRADVYRVDLAGWVVGVSAPVTAVEVRIGGHLVRRAPLDHVRPDVAAAKSNRPHAAQSGFNTSISVIGLKPEIEIKLHAVFEDQSKAPLGVIRARHQPLCTGFEPILQPLMLTALGRSGTTWMMHLLSEHPHIVVHRTHPYELRSFTYWMHMAKVLSQPTDPHGSTQADEFHIVTSTVGQNPFYPERVSATPELEHWFGRDYIEKLAAFCQQSTEECYTRIAASQGQSNPRYFAEKHPPTDLVWLMRELYPYSREIFLVRDFRDIVTSMQSFNEKQGQVIFNQMGKSEEEYARNIRDGPLREFLQSWLERQDHAHLVRYEDLIRRPKDTLRSVLQYLEVENDEATIAGMLERALQETPEATQHRTTSEAEASIGRWRRELSPKLQAEYQEIFTDVLEQFGYRL